MKQTHIVMVALVAGFIGGISGARLMRPPEQTVLPSVIRAHAFELVDEAEQVISYWGIDKNDYAVMAFGNHWPAELSKTHPHPSLRDLGNQMIAVGVAGDGPFLNMRAPDGKNRVQLYTDMWGKSSLVMGDENGGRIYLGIVRSDTPGPQDRDWSLAFFPDQATIGIHALEAHGRQYYRGMLSVSRDEVEYPRGQRQPPK